MTYALITDVLRNLVRGIGPKQSDLLEKYAEALSYLEPRSKRTDSASVSPVPEAERTWLFDTIVQFLIELSQRTPYVLFVDDIEWAEEGTIQFLRYLIRNTERGRIILCLALCEEQVVRREALEPMVEDVRERIHLQGLGRDGIDVLTTSMLGGDRLSPGHTDRILEETRGNPLFVQELMRSMVDKALVFRHNKWAIEEAAFEDVVVSKTMKHVLRNRLKGLKKQVYDVLETGSMFSKEFELSLIKEIVEYSDEDLLSAVGELLRRRLIVERADGYSFAGSQLRLVVYEAAKKDRRRKLHQAIAELLETRAGEKTDAVAGELAFHFARGVNREKALDFSIKAGNAAKSLYANNEAARYFEQALTLIDKKNDRYGWLVRELGDTYRLTGEYDRAIDRYRKGLLLSLSTSEKAGIYCDIGVSYRKKGEHRSALEAYDRSMAILRENGDERVKARLLQETSWIYQAQADYDKALTAAFKGLRIARRNNDLQEMERIYHNLGTVYLRKGKPDTSMRCFNKSLEIKRKTNDLRGQAASHNNLGVVYSVKGDWDKALHHYARGLDIHEKTKDPTGTAMGYKNLGIVCYRQSDLTKAEEYYRKALDIEQRIGDSVGIAGSYNNIGLVQNKQRRWQEAIDSFNRSLKMKEKAGDTRGIAGCYNNLGSVYKSQGDWDKAASYYRRSLGLKEKIKDSLGTANSLTNLGSVYTDQGKNKQALSCLERAREIGDRIGSKSTLLDVHQALGLLYLNKKETEESLTHSMEALNLAMKLGSRREEGTVCQLLCRVHRLMGNDRKAEEYLSRSIKLLKKAKMEVELAEAYFEMGEWKLQSGDAEAGRQYLREAREIFERLGMEEDLRKAKDVLKPSVSKDLVGVYQISTIINSILDLRQLLDKIMDIAIDTLGAQRGVLILKDEETGELRMDVARGVEREDIEDATLISESIVKDVASGGNPLLTTDAIGDSRFESRRSVVDYHITSVLCVPLKIREKAIGAIYLDHRKVSDLFDSDDLSFLTTFANLAAVAIENARLHEKLQKENIYLRHETEERYKFGNMVTKNSKMRKLYQLMERVADTSTSILLEGETGTGKEVVARTIHYNGPRREKKFVPVDCATIPHTLFEGELFGYVKGAFTGATSDKKGLFAEADGGTLFLDEVANNSLEAQAKLLRAIQEREVRRLGDDKSRKVDIRIIAASNIDLKAEVKAKRFRPDLYYRLNVITVKLPPLCERKEDIPLLAQLFLEKYWKQVKVGQGFDVDCKGFAESTMRLLLDYNWPGNVRELEHQIERAVTLTSGDLITEDLLSIKPAFVGAGLAPALKEFPTFEPKEGALKDAVETLEQEMIERALRKCKHKKDAAEVLGLSRFGLDKKLERYGMK
jgi:Nif-specific regulatory protein